MVTRNNKSSRQSNSSVHADRSAKRATTRSHKHASKEEAAKVRKSRRAAARKNAGAQSFDRSAYGTPSSTPKHGSHSRVEHESANRVVSPSGYRGSAHGYQTNGTHMNGSMSGSEQYSRNNNTKDYVARAKAQKKKSKRKKIALVSIIIVAVLALGGVGAAWAYIMQLESNMQRGVDEDLLNSLTVTDSPSDPFYMLLIGVDKSQDREATDEYGGSYRTDSMILTRVDPKAKTVTMVSIPRDTKVTIPGHGTQKINAAYAFGGPSGAIEAVSDLAGVDINHYAEIDFDGFKAIVDSLGGVDVDVAMEINDSMAGGHVDQGPQTLNGEQALILCRSRHAYDAIGDGDAMRAANQRMVLSAIMNKVVSSDVGTMTNMIGTLSNYVTTDFSVASIIGLAQNMMGINVAEDVYTAACPTTSSYENDIWWEILDEADWRAMMKRVDQGLPPTEESMVDPASGVVTASAGDGGKTGLTSGGSSADTSLQGIKIAVKNGSGINGCASSAASKLTPLGAVVETGNADDFKYKETLVIYNNPSDQAKAQAIADALGVGTTKKNNGVYSFAGDYLVVVGADWK